MERDETSHNNTLLILRLRTLEPHLRKRSRSFTRLRTIHHPPSQPQLNFPFPSSPSFPVLPCPSRTTSTTSERTTQGTPAPFPSPASPCTARTGTTRTSRTRRTRTRKRSGRRHLPVNKRVPLRTGRELSLTLRTRTLELLGRRKDDWRRRGGCLRVVVGRNGEVGRGIGIGIGEVGHQGTGKRRVLVLILMLLRITQRSMRVRVTLLLLLLLSRTRDRQSRSPNYRGPPMLITPLLRHSPLPHQLILRNRIMLVPRQRLRVLLTQRSQTISSVFIPMFLRQCVPPRSSTEILRAHTQV
jgi:hypothetical protein